MVYLAIKKHNSTKISLKGVRLQVIILSQNAHKISEIERIFEGVKVSRYTDFIAPFTPSENGESFQANAIIKLNALAEKLCENLGEIPQDSALMSEDSGISVEALGGKPGIYSSRYAHITSWDNRHDATDASDIENLAKMINELKSRNLTQSRAKFISCVAVKWRRRILTAHGFLRGRVITQARGENGFGYDPIFIPDGFDKTLGEADSALKDSISHRKNALALMKILLQ